MPTGPHRIGSRMTLAGILSCSLLFGSGIAPASAATPSAAPPSQETPSQAAAPVWETPLSDALDGPGFSTSGGLYYRENYEQSAGGYRFVPGTARNPDGALRLSVNSLCPPTARNCSERAEIWEKTALRVPYGEGVWRGFQVRFGKPVPQDAHRYLIAQWKREIGPAAKGDYSPFLAFRLNRGHQYLTIETDARPVHPQVHGQCPEGSLPVWSRPAQHQMRILIATDPGWRNALDGPEFSACTDAVKIVRHADMPAASDRVWTDYAVYTRPDAHGNGRIEVLANGRRIVSVSGHIGHDDTGLGPNQYFKFGPYRAAAKGQWTMFYADFRRGPRCTDVLPDTAACAATGLP